MARRAGSADLPLHGGRVPKWLGDRMTRLGAVITQAIVHEYGRDELLRRLAQALPLVEQAIRLSPRDPLIYFLYLLIGRAHRGSRIRTLGPPVIASVTGTATQAKDIG
jgi:hypothetical protein